MRNREPKVTVTVSLPVELVAELKARAKQEDRTVSQQLQRLVRQDLERKEPGFVLVEQQ